MVFVTITLSPVNVRTERSGMRAMIFGIVARVIQEFGLRSFRLNGTLTTTTVLQMEGSVSTRLRNKRHVYGPQ